MGIEKTFDNMRDIVEREMLIHGIYAGWEISDPKLLRAGAICGGRKYCAIGTMIISSGVKAYTDYSDQESDRTDEFQDVLAAYHTDELEGDLAIVLKALNDASNEYMDTHERDDGLPWNRRGFGENRTFEAFFEDNDPGREALLWVIDRAKELTVEVPA